MKLDSLISTAKKYLCGHVGLSFHFIEAEVELKRHSSIMKKPRAELFLHYTLAMVEKGSKE